MRELWSYPARLERWRAVELAVLSARREAGEIGDGPVREASDAPAPTPAEVDEEERVTRHDFVAFLNCWLRGMSRETASVVHVGMTSSDVVDSALAICLRDAGLRITQSLTRLTVTLRDHAIEHRDTLRLGRTHGVGAAPTTWGLRTADFAFAAARARDDVAQATNAASVGKISGAVGTHTGVARSVEVSALRSLGLDAAETSTQVVSRDRIARWGASLALAVGVCESVATEVRSGQRTGIDELSEAFAIGQTGSSAMPHKRNPVRSEQICGLARLARGYVGPLYEDVPLWNERDISHSSVERIALPQLAALAEYCAAATADVIERLVVDTERMRANLMEVGAVAYSDRVLDRLVSRGLPRDIAYPIVQQAALEPSEFFEAVRRSAADHHIEIFDDEWADTVAIPDVSRTSRHVFEALAALS